MTFEVIHGDCLEVMAGMEAGSVDAVVTDPPYGLKFMGKHWDHGLPGVDFWTEVIRVLAPSHYLLAFGGTRTWHRLACALEDAGFEIRDTLCWLYGSGFPKGKACLKPAWEPVILARKPGPMRELGIEECRISIEGCIDPTRRSYNQPGNGLGRGEVYAGGFSHTYTGSENPHPDSPRHHAEGRWPANLVLDEEAGRELDGAVGERPAGVAVRSRSGGKTFGTDRDKPPMDDMTYSDSGGPSRFFYCPKASRAERNAGLEGMEERAADPMAGHAARRQADDGEAWCESQGRKLVRAANHHPTVKPVALMEWLVRLVAREGDLVLDPFTGSGTTGIAAVNQGRDFIGIEREAEYVEIARRRIEAAAAQTRLPV